ncbi:MAG: CoA-transferase subunit beta [Syntrophobacteraceae bacterium]
MSSKVYSKDYTLTELMIVCAAREVDDGDVAFIGTGLPFLACALAKKTHAPRLVSCSEQGQIDANPLLWRTPRAIGDLAMTAGAKMCTDLVGVMHRLTYGEFDIGFLAGAQVDKFGNVNSTVIGDYSKPKVRFPGSGGANAIATFAKKHVLIFVHRKHQFVDKVDYITSPGYLSGPGARENCGCPAGTGPSAVITTLGVLRFDKDTKEMYLETVHPKVTVEEVKANTSWDLQVAPTVTETEPPTAEEIRIIREELDPYGIYIRREEFQKRAIDFLTNGKVSVNAEKR